MVEYSLINPINEVDRAKEFADIQIVFSQIWNDDLPTTNLDYELVKKIEDNWRNEKKTINDKGEMILK